MKKFISGLGAGAAAAALVLAGCTPPGEGDGADDDGGGSSILNVGWNEAFKSMNAQTTNTNSVSNAIVLYLMNDNFGYYDDNLEIQEGNLGTVEQVSEDPLQVKYTFNDDATWSDGTPVDAADLVLQWAAISSNFNTEAEEDVDRQEAEDDSGGEEVAELEEGAVFFDAASPGAALIEDFPEISEDGKEVTFEYTKPFSDWNTELGFGTDGVGVPAHVTAQHALGEEDPEAAKRAVLDAIETEDNAALSELANMFNTGFNFTSMPEDESLIVHNGPYKMTGFEEQQNLTLERDENYTGPTDVGVDQVVYHINGDPMAHVQAVENGEIDVIQPQATVDVLDAAEAIEGVDVTVADGATYEHFDLTMDNGGPFDPETYGGDEETALLVRKAFLKTLPRDQIMETLIQPLDPESELRDSFTQPPGAPLYEGIVEGNGVAEEYPGSDTDAAEALLDEAGVDDLQPVRVLYDDTNQRRVQQFSLIQEQAEAAGFEIIDEGDVNWGTRGGDGTYDGFLFGWQSGSTGVTDSDAMYRTGQLNNNSGYSSDEVDALYDELQTELDEGRQLEILAEVEQHLVDDAFGAPIFQHPSLTIARERVQNVSTTTVSPTIFWNYWEWEVE